MNQCKQIDLWPKHYRQLLGICSQHNLWGREVLINFFTRPRRGGEGGGGESFHTAFHGLSQQSCFGAAHSETKRVKRRYMPVHSMNLLGLATILSATGLSKRAAETCGRFQRYIGLSCASVLKFRHLTL